MNKTRGPRSAATEHVAMSTARSAVLATVREEDRWCAVKELSTRVGQHTNTVREHLDALVDAGLVLKDLAKPQGRGRPALMYRAVPQADGGATVLAATNSLAAQLGTLPQGPQVAEAAGRAWAKTLITDAAAVGDPSPSVLNASRSLGFDPQEVSEDQIVFRACPLLVAARQTPDVVCSVHAGLIAGLIADAPDKGMELTPLGPNGCVLRLNLPSPAHGALLTFPQRGTA